MKKSLFVCLFLFFFAVTPMALAWSQNVPVQSRYQEIVLFLSLGAFGLLLGQFWLSRLLPPQVTEVKLYKMLRWHKVLGYTVGVIMLVHPILMVARRFWVQESPPFDNLLLVLQAKAMLPAMIAWGLLVLIVLLALVRHRLRAGTWRVLHGLLSSGGAGFATWHAATTGRHSHAALIVFWVVLATGAVAMWLQAFLPALTKTWGALGKGVAHETVH